MTKVRAHVRRGTRGVRSHYRMPPADVRIAHRGGELRAQLNGENGIVRVNSMRAFSIPARNTIFLNEMREETPEDVTATVNHEALHLILNDEAGNEASRGLDRLRSPSLFAHEPRASEEIEPSGFYRYVPIRRVDRTKGRA